MIQVKMFNDALKNNYVVPAFNVSNFEIFKGLLNSVKELKSPIILQFSESAINYLGDEVVKSLIVTAKKEKLPISIHLDHGKTYEICKKAISLGFDSVMIDGSALPYKENVKLTKKVVMYAHKHNVSVEGELGVLSVVDDDAKMTDEQRFTDPIQAKEFVNLTGVDSLAVSIGTNHGVNKYIGEPKIRFDILKKIEKELPNLPIVLHGASLIEEKYIKIINENGGDIKNSAGNKDLLKNIYKTNICKLNMDTDFRLAYTSAVRKTLAEQRDVFNPRTYGKAGIEAVKLCAEERIKKICKSNNRVK